MTDFELGEAAAVVPQAAADGRLSRLLEDRRRDPLLRRMLALADTLAAGAVALSFTVSGQGASAALVALAFAPAWIVLAKVHGLYDRDQRTLRHVTSDEASSILLWSLSGSALLVIFLGVVAGVSSQGATTVQSWAVVATSAFVFRGAMRVAWRNVTPPERTVIVGAGELADATRRKLELFGDIHVRVVAQQPDVTLDEFGDPEGLSAWLGDIDRVIVASQAIDEATLVRLIGICRRDGIRLSVVPPVRGMFGTAVKLNHVADLPVVEYSTWDVSRSTQLLKRSLDITVAVIGLVVLSPLLLAIAVAVRVTSEGGAIFTQTRAGLNGKPFRMFKSTFRPPRGPSARDREAARRGGFISRDRTRGVSGADGGENALGRRSSLIRRTLPRCAAGSSQLSYFCFCSYCFRSRRAPHDRSGPGF